MKTLILVLNNDNTVYIKKTYKANLPDILTIKDNKYEVYSNAFYYKFGMFGSKRYIVYRKSNPFPITLNLPDAQVEFQKLFQTKIISEFLASVKEDLTKEIMFLIIGIIMGFVASVIMKLK